MIAGHHMTTSAQDRFRSMLPEVPADPDACMIWQGGKDRHGYGRFYLARGRVVFAHRVSFYLSNGSIVDDLGVLHACDNPSCVRPSHLFQGDQAANMKDMSEKGRGRTKENAARGSQIVNAKINEEQASAIFAALQGAPRSKTGRVVRGHIPLIAARFGVSAFIVAGISKGAWQHVRKDAL